MEFLIIDIETTGFDPKYEKILEIGICLINSKTKSIKKIFESIINPGEFNEESWIFSHSDLRTCSKITFSKIKKKNML